MLRYKVIKPHVDYGIYRETNTIIADVSLISNLPIKLWDGTLVPVNDAGKTLEVPKKTPAIPNMPPKEVNKDLTVKTKKTVNVVSTVTAKK